jgi:hypothetical protein
MNKLIFPFFAILFLFLISCEKESNTDLLPENEQVHEDGATTNRSADKRDVCHNGNIINISVNAIPAHQAHGDAVDMDEDGYFDIDNPCSATDCNDNDALINPAADEIPCNDIDENCDGVDGEEQEQIWYLQTDDDADGYFGGVITESFLGTCPPEGFISIDLINLDCNDEDPFINPDSPEICDDNIDQNCSGLDNDHIGTLINTNTNTAYSIPIGVANFGPQSGNWTGDLANTNPADGCDPISTDLNGKIALIDRGICFFSTKVANAQDAGAVAVIICNNIPGFVPIIAAGTVDIITIPSIFITQEDCASIRVNMPTNVELNFDVACIQPGQQSDGGKIMITSEKVQSINSGLIK